MPAAGIPEPGELTLQVGAVTVEPGDVMTAFATGGIGIARNVGQDWAAGDRVAVRLTRAAAGEPVVSGAGLSVADAEVHEAEGAVLAFQVTLDEAQTSTVSVRYATSDGTATAGSDYVARSGALRFAPGETAKTVSVPVLDDALDDDGETLFLTLSNPFGAQLVDGVATGTIANTDPMPRDWITRFGRTVGSQVVESVTARFESDGRSHVTLGGVGLGGSGQYPTALSDRDAWDTATQRSFGDREMTGRELLLGTSFHLTSTERKDGGPVFATWGRVASDSFEADVGDVRVEGDVTTGLIGFDAEWDRVLAGVMLSQSKGDGSYAPGAASGSDRDEVESTLTGVYPYARFEMSERVSMWGLAGAGSGELTLRQEGGAPIDTDLEMRMGALGVKGTVLDGSGPSGVGLNVRSDAMWVRTESDGVAGAGGFESAEGEVTRLRLVVEGERVFAAGAGATFTPSGELGLRHDGGDADTGTGVEVGAGIRYTAGALSIEGQVRTLVAHEESGYEESGYEEWGASGAIRFTPDASGRGLSLTVAPTWGNAASATERLWTAHDATGLAVGGDNDAAGRLDATVGYGFALFDGRWTGTPELGLGLTDTYRETVLGWRLDPARSTAYGLRLEGSRHEPVSGAEAPEHRVRVRLTARW